MARPRGLRLNRAALDDLLQAKGLSMTTAAERAGIALTTLSGLANGDHGASPTVAHQIANGIACSPEALFPTLTRRFAEVDVEVAVPA